MQLYIDDANVKEITRLCDLYPIDGVTTNPSILARYGTEPKKTLHAIRDVIGKERLLFVQVLSNEAEAIVQEALRILEEMGDNTVIKIPVIPQGVKAIRLLSEAGIATCATAIYTPMQAFLAAKAGASFAAPYVNRIDNLGFDGVGVAEQIQEIFENNAMRTIVLAAAFKNSGQILELCRFGVGACTAAPDVIDGLIRNREIDAAVADFARDYSVVPEENRF